MPAVRPALACLLFLGATCLWQPPTYAADKKPASTEPANAQAAAAKKAAEDAVTAAKYQALVATLPADQQAWERTLEQNLGSFYLPIHKRLRVEGRSSCWDFVQDDP
ncbi:MAG TPA: hypothetical protein VG433_02790 [Pirellulales bacterium]|nr:hypothetical protein [Pirellulales bacterium]